MKVYTEVNYEWRNGSLVQTSSKSFNYSGDITLCGGGGGGGGGLTKALTKATSTVGDVGGGVTKTLAKGVETVGDIGKGAGDFVADAGKAATKDLGGVLDGAIGGGVEGIVNAVKDPIGTIQEGPKGTLGDIGDKLYGGTTKDLVEGMQGKTEEESVAAPTLAAEEVDAQAALTAQQQKRKQSQGRGAANLTAGQSATMLTS